MKYSPIILLAAMTAQTFGTSLLDLMKKDVKAAFASPFYR
jgi:hypothetical protein